MRKKGILLVVLLSFKGMLFCQEDSRIRSEEGKDLQVLQEEYNRMLAKALNLQLEADSLARQARDQKILIREIPDEAMKKFLASGIQSLEEKAAKIQNQADALYKKARDMKETLANTIRPDNEGDILVLYKTVNDIKVYHYSSHDSLSLAEKEPDVVQNQNLFNSSISENPVKEEEVKSRDEFSILEQSPYHSGNPFHEGLDPISGLTYRIQLGVYSNPVSFEAFGGIYPVCFTRIQNSNMLKYFAGLFYSLVSVTEALNEVRSIGFPDAFMVAFLDGNPISAEKAREIEYEQYKL